MCIVKYDVVELAAIIGYQFEDEDDVQNYEEIEVYYEARDEGFTECPCCGLYVSYDDFSGNYDKCDDCLDAQ